MAMLGSGFGDHGEGYKARCESGTSWNVPLESVLDDATGWEMKVGHAG
jgi:hypothetical protein